MEENWEEILEGKAGSDPLGFLANP